MPITVKIKQVTGGDTLEVETEPEVTIGELKEKVGEKLDAEATAIKLIYRGQILKDAQTVESYGVQGWRGVHSSKARDGRGSLAAGRPPEGPVPGLPAAPLYTLIWCPCGPQASPTSTWCTA